MKTVLIIHGIGGHAGIHWQQWLHDELTEKGFKVLMPDLTDSDHPDRQAWLNEIHEAVKDIDPRQLIIVGHSLGVTTALDFIEQADGPIDGLLSVAGFAEDYGASLNSYFLSERSIDFDKVKSKLNWLAIVYGSDDPYVPQAALKHVADSLGVQPIIISKGGHLNSEAGFTQFPQLLDLIK